MRQKVRIEIPQILCVARSGLSNVATFWSISCSAITYEYFNKVTDVVRGWSPSVLRVHVTSLQSCVRSL